MKGIGLLFTLFFTLNSFSQTIPTANNWFDKYEYGKAASSYEEISDKSLLSPLDLQRWCYASFISENYEKSYQLSDSLIKDKNTSPFFYYVHAFSAMAIQKYKIAEGSFKLYKTKDSEFFVDTLIASCEQIPTWKPEEHVELKSLSFNGSKADLSGASYKNNLIVFHETGIDQFRDQVADTLLENTELLFVRPSVFSPVSNEIQLFKIPDEFKNHNVISLAIDSSTNEVYVTMNNPIDQNEFLRSPHIYKGKLTNDTLENLQPWIYSGLEDSSSTAHATINSSSNYIVFSKQGDKTQGADLYYTHKKNGLWGKPQPIISLNTNQDEMYPLFIGDSLLSFASNGRVGYGGLDIYLTTFNEATTGEIKHLKAPINSVSDDFNFTYYLTEDAAYFTSNRKEGEGDDDVYYIKLKESIPIDTTEEDHTFDDWQDIVVYFDFDKSTLKEKEQRKIDNIIAYKEAFDQIELSVEGHCDSRGIDDYNMSLGQQRANTVQDVLVSLGISETRIKAISKGDREPAINCEGTCDEKQHLLNRFVRIKLVR